MTPGRRRPLRGRCFGRLLRDSLRLSRHRVPPRRSQQRPAPGTLSSFGDDSWRYPLESRSCDRRYYTPFRAAILRCGRDWRGRS